MPKFLFPLYLVFFSFLMAACETTPHSDADFEVYGEEPAGPGLLTGEEGKLVLFKQDKKPAETQPEMNKSAGSAATSKADATLPADMSAADWEEFAAFKRWLAARRAQDASYQEFLQWRRFEAYKDWQQTQ